MDELSAEIDASAQLSEKDNEDISQQFMEILEIINRISTTGGNAPMNAGVELEKFIAVTEHAANKIMNASDRIIDKYSAEEDLQNRQAPEKILDEDKLEVQDIFASLFFLRPYWPTGTKNFGKYGVN